MLLPPITRSSGDGVMAESISCGFDAANSTSTHRVTNLRPTEGTKQTGASRRMRRSTGRPGPIRSGRMPCRASRIAHAVPATPFPTIATSTFRTGTA